MYKLDGSTGGLSSVVGSLSSPSGDVSGNNLVISCCNDRLCTVRSLTPSHSFSFPHPLISLLSSVSVGSGIAIDPFGYVYIVGSTMASLNNLFHSGGSDVFVAKYT